MARVVSSSVRGLALAAMAAVGTVAVSAASPGGGHNSPHVLLVHGGGGGGHGGGFGGGGGRGFSGGGGFGGGTAHSFSQSSRSFSGGARSVQGSARSFQSGASNIAGGARSSFYHGDVGHDGYSHGGWNYGNWAWHSHGYYGGWWGGGYPLVGWLGGYGWWYPGYYDGGDYCPYNYYNDDSSTGTVAVSGAEATSQPYAAAEQELPPPQQTDQPADEGRGDSAYLNSAIQSFQSGDYRNAMRLAEHAIVDSPRDPESHEVVVLSSLANKDYRTAATEAHAVIALAGVPSWHQVYAIYHNVDAYTSHLRALEDYVEAHPKSAEGQFLLGFQYMSTGHTANAHEHLAIAAELTPRDKVAQELLKATGDAAPASQPGASEAQ